MLESCHQFGILTSFDLDLFDQFLLILGLLLAHLPPSLLLLIVLFVDVLQRSLPAMGHCPNQYPGL